MMLVTIMFLSLSYFVREWTMSILLKQTARDYVWVFFSWRYASTEATVGLLTGNHL